MTKLFASDFDGTLYIHDSGELVSQPVMAAIAAFREAGGLFGACTGRPLRALTAQTAGVVPFDFYITSSGAALYDRDLQPLFVSTIPRELVREMYERYRGAAGDENVFLVADGHYWTLAHGGDGAVPIRRADSFDEIPGSFLGFSLLFPGADGNERAGEVAGEVAGDYGGVASSHQNLNSVDVVAAGCSKGRGLSVFAEHFGATLTAGMGDSFNDLPLLEKADVAYSFRRADGRVRAAADLLVDDAADAIRDFTWDR